MIKLNVKKYSRYIVFFIIFFSLSSTVMIALKKRTEERLKQLYTARIAEIIKDKELRENEGQAAKELVDTKEAVRMLQKFSPEEIRKYQLELRQRIKLYEQKVALLNKSEKEIEAFKTDIENRKTEIESMRTKLDEALTFISKERIDLNSDLVVFDESERKNLKRLAGIYASMEALKAAEVMSKLSHDTSAKVLTGMPSKKSAKILSEIDPSGAATISEQMKRLQVTDSSSGETIKERNIMKLAAIYQKMDTEKAVSVIEKLEKKTAISILSKMDENKLARILELMETEEASKLTEDIRNIMKKESQKVSDKKEGV